MGIRIRQAVLDEDRSVLVEMIGRYLTPLSDGKRFAWLYRGNPHGQARAWLACSPSDSTIIGMAAAFPRRFLIRGVETVGWVLGDFCVSDRNRSLGPALQLQRACLGGLDCSGMPIFYDFPSENMMAVYRRLGIESQGRMIRFAKLLRGDQKVGEAIKVPWLRRSLGSFTNFLLSLGARRPRWIADCEISVHTGPCGEEFSGLAHKVSSKYDMCVQRSAEYLNWRYLAHPNRHHEILKLESKGELLAYVVFTRTKADASIVDLFGTSDPNLICALVQALVNLLREGGVCTVSVPLSDSHPWTNLFGRLGFYPRESCPVILHRPQQGAATDGTSSERWFLMDGDRDS
jgi:hypothetical protein